MTSNPVLPSDVSLSLCDRVCLKPALTNQPDYQTTRQGLVNMDGKQKDGKRKKRRLTSKDRRNIENDEIFKLRDLLPISAETREGLDKASVLKQTIAYIRTQLYTPPTPNKTPAIMDAKTYSAEGETMLDVLTGFLILVEKGGQILFVSNHVEQYLGYKPVDMIGENLVQFVHIDDHDKIRHHFYRGSRLPVDERLFTIKMKYQVVRQAKDRNRFRYGYLPMEWSGRMKEASSGSGGGAPPALVAAVRPSAAVLLIELRLWGYMFISRHDVSRRCTFVDTRCANLLGYGADELLGATFADFYHPEDKPRKQVCHTMLVKYGTASSTCFRFRGKNGRYRWMRCRGSVLYDNKGLESAYISMNYIISEQQAISYIWEEYYTMPPEDTRPQIPEVAVEKRMMAKDIIKTHANPCLPNKSQVEEQVTSHVPEGMDYPKDSSIPTGHNHKTRSISFQASPSLKTDEFMDFLVGNTVTLTTLPSSPIINLSPEHTESSSPGFNSSDGSCHGYNSDDPVVLQKPSPESSNSLLVQDINSLSVPSPSSLSSLDDSLDNTSRDSPIHSSAVKTPSTSSTGNETSTHMWSQCKAIYPEDQLFYEQLDASFLGHLPTTNSSFLHSDLNPGMQFYGNISNCPQNLPVQHCQQNLSDFSHNNVFGEQDLIDLEHLCGSLTSVGVPSTDNASPMPFQSVLSNCPIMMHHQEIPCADTEEVYKADVSIKIHSMYAGPPGGTEPWSDRTPEGQHMPAPEMVFVAPEAQSSIATDFNNIGFNIIQTSFPDHGVHANVDLPIPPSQGFQHRHDSHPAH